MPSRAVVFDFNGTLSDDEPILFAIYGTIAHGIQRFRTFQLVAGVLLHRPLSRIPENSLKFAVGGLLTGFGVFWVCEGLGAPWPGGDWAILGLVAFYLASAMVMASLVRRRVQTRAA